MALFLAVLTLGYMGGIHWLSSQPGDVDPEQAGIAGIMIWTSPALQNLLHVPVFGLLSWLLYHTLNAWGMRTPVALAIAFILTALYGILDEWHQVHVPGRYASLTDIVLNILGAGLVLCWCASRTTKPVSRRDQSGMQ